MIQEAGNGLNGVYHEMKEIEILGANRFDTFTKTRAGSRAVVVREGKILLSHESVSGWWLIPGGGMEEGETPAQCCVREVEEETGLIVKPLREFLTMYEYYEEYRYISHYFVCEAAGAGQMRLTDAEKRRGLTPAWLPLREAVEIFSRHQDWAAVSEEKRGAYLREYTALGEYLKATAWTIREAGPKDEGSIRALFKEMLQTIYHTDIVNGYADGALDRFFSGGEDRVYVAEAERVVGFLSVEVHREEEPYLYLDDFSVTAAYRNLGIGNALLHAAEAYAKALKIPAMALHVERANEAARRLYERWGYAVVRTDGSRYLMGKGNRENLS